ncbi:hypothetical protein CDAR_550881 [Caerostris darwini]|uniref:Uncharacterized protein n=1 Tax=Caerostris darwini TaxID=1538125 RepID=A0AAV4QMN5_9ARAC|nr:hypothetical protein CDAR_550881 [Caerostris darwini]
MSRDGSKKDSTSAHRQTRENRVGRQPNIESRCTPHVCPFMRCLATRLTTSWGREGEKTSARTPFHRTGRKDKKWESARLPRPVEEKRGLARDEAIENREKPTEEREG